MIQRIKITAGVLGVILIAGCSSTQKAKVSPPAPGPSIARSFSVVHPPPLASTNTVTITASVPSIIYANRDLATANWIAVNDAVADYLIFLDDQPQDFFIGKYAVSTNHLEWNTPDDDQVTGFKIYYGTESFTESVVAGFQTSLDLIITNPPAVIKVGATSYDAAGNESDFSNIIVRTNQIYLLRSALRLQVSR